MTILTIDIGSSSVRTNLFDRNAKRHDGFEAQLQYNMRSSGEGEAEIDPDDLSKYLFSAIDETLDKARSGPSSIEGVGFCSLVSNVLGVDGKGRPTTPIYTWADTRCAPQTEALRKKLDEVKVHERTGCRIHTSYLPARLLWLREEQPKLYKRTARWISLGDYIHLTLVGHYAQSLSVASWGGLLNRRTLDWDDWLLEQIGVARDKLPPLVDAYESAGKLKPEYARRWSALAQAEWFPCVGDGVASNLGSGCYSPEDWAVQVGTSSAMRAVVPDNPDSTTSKSAPNTFHTPHSPFRIPMGLWCYRCDRDTALVGGALSEGGNLSAWLRDTLHIEDLKAAEKEAASLQPDSHGLTLLPFIAGERSPGWHPSAHMLIAGLSLSTRPAHILRAAQEAITYRFAAVFDLLNDVLPPPRRVVASGGALLNTPGWMQMLADTLGHSVTASKEEEASSKGAAMIALRALGHLADYSHVPASFGHTFHPNANRQLIYRKAMARQQDLYKAVYPWAE